ncbi:COG1361 S-layer family protein, partial [Methanoregula sp.]|uniref:COG1361 S-layer family protein n=1 Tax=Methanoregula sp. TaxID=2052170 RepID=UPI000CC0D32B
KPALTVLKTVPDGVSPGDDIPVDVIIRNDGLSRADQLTLTINSSTASISPSTPGTYHISQLQKGENATLNMVFSSDKKAPIGLNRVLLTLTYAGADGTILTQSEILAIHMKGRAKIGIASLTTDPVRVRKGSLVSLVIRLENTGTDNANSVKATIDLPFPGSKDAYVGRIEPENDAPAVFALQAANPGTYTYNLTVQYEDDFGVQTRQENLQMTVFDGDSSGLIAAVLLLLVLAAGAGYWYFRIRKKGIRDA